MKKFWKILRLAALGPFILLMGAEGDEAAAKAAAEAKAKAEAEAKAKAEEDKKKADEEARNKKVEMTQAELDALIERRLARGSKAAVEEYLKGLGKSKEEIDALIKANAEAEEKNKTELQKAQEKAAKAEAAQKSALDAANAKVLKAEFIVMTGAKDIQIPADRADDAYQLAKSQLDALKPDEKTGEFDKKEIESILKDLVKAKPWLKGEGGSNDVGGGHGGAGGSGKVGSFGEKIAKERAEANKAGDNLPAAWK